ncbi:rhodanese-like domain-containing protein [Phaeodactylibacter sp.]|uniref:rhodanese-like domain-containing protein n=1 Tax=Phaeodactylibacter sp. TaxID=1940289 RepID=UPI0025D1F91D|nr:rhodanese-like domain-containing protein [Phaeodactylibacter sp.]MCI4651580.1 rhodanese-like domain-containing protein [Phaeodactylibacter sp.]MCI5092557.1 rhodanese-like domain-containing protein [Phaeodactylibacter sp.]
MYKTLFIAILSVFTLNACQSQSAAEEQYVLSKKEYQEKMTAIEDLQLLDVRTPDEYNAGHIEGAELINFFDDDFVQQVEARFDKEEPLMLYCRSGNRSAKATAKLKAVGFKEIYDLKGGYKTWE